MIVNFEFLGNEPIENVITCMHYKVDKVVYFGYAEAIERMQKQTERFLKEDLGVGNVVFHPVEEDNLRMIMSLMKEKVKAELDAGNRVYFDITGGEDLILVAFGILSRELETPMHYFNVAENRMIEMDDEVSTLLSRDVEPRELPMTLELMVRMYGGIINTRLHKSIKSLTAAETEDLERLYKIAKSHWEVWNPLSDRIRKGNVPTKDYEFNRLIEELEKAGYIKAINEDGHYHIKYRDENIKEIIWDGGSILELHTCLEMQKRSDEAMVGVHLDWDGVIHGEGGEDVLNEIDVLALNGNIPTFISCKSGHLAAQSALHALYELDTVARRFGGRYAKKILVVTHDMSDAHIQRGREMGIEIVRG